MMLFIIDLMEETSGTPWLMTLSYKLQADLLNAIKDANTCEKCKPAIITLMTDIILEHLKEYPQFEKEIHASIERMKK